MNNNAMTAYNSYNLQSLTAGALAASTFTSNYFVDFVENLDHNLLHFADCWDYMGSSWSLSEDFLHGG